MSKVIGHGHTNETAEFRALNTYGQGEINSTNESVTTENSKNLNTYIQT